MEESEEILLTSLATSGVSIPSSVSSIQDLTPSSLFSISAQALSLIDNTTSFPTSLPESMADRFKICAQFSSAVKTLGYIGDMSFHKFLYPSEEDLYKLVRFLVEKLPESSEGAQSSRGGDSDIKARKKTKEGDLPGIFKDWSEKDDDQGMDLHYRNVGANSKEKSEVQEFLDDVAENESGALANKAHSTHQKMDGLAVVDVSIPGTHDLGNEKLDSLENGRDSVKKSKVSGKDASGNAETSSTQRDDINVLTSSREESLKIKSRIGMLQDQEKLLIEEVTSKSIGSEQLEQEYNLLKSSIEMVFDDQHPVDYHIEQLSERVGSGKHNLVELESQWATLRKPLEEKKRGLEESVYATMPGAQEKLQELKELELEKRSILYEIKKREEENSKLSADLEKQPKLAARRSSYIQRITEITKNSRKQDADIERILRDTRELQLESNSVQERLHRTYAVVDETIFREAKKDPVGRQAYMLLTTIHESFEQIAAKILAADRTRREVGEHEAKLAVMASRSLNINKLQADLDAIRQENECLEQRLQENSISLDSSS